MSLKFWLNKPAAFVKVWQQRGLRRAVYESLQYLVWFGPRRQARLKFEQWLADNTLTPEQAAAIRAETAQWSDPPTFSVLVPVYNTKPVLLKKSD